MLVALLSLALAGCAGGPECTQAQFDAFLEQEFVDAVTSEYLALYIYVSDPQQYGIDKAKIPVNLGARNTLESRKQNREEIERSLRGLKSFRREQLDPKQQDSYDIYLFYLERAQALSQEKFDYFDDSFSDTGIYTQLPTMFADFRLHTEQDIADLIGLMEDTRPYLQSCITFAKMQQEKGMLSVNCDAVMEYCSGILKEGEHSAVLESIKSGIDALEIDAAKKRDYQEEMAQVFRTSFLPAYQDLMDAMADLKAKGAQPKPLAEMPSGKEYYEALLQYSVGTAAPLFQYKLKLEAGLGAALADMYQILSREGTLERFISADLSTGYTDYRVMLGDLEQLIKGHFPDIGDVEYTIEPIAPALAVNTIAAYFNIPTLDGSEPELIKVNTTRASASITDLETFMTVAHEGFPGHLYQYGYMRKNLKDQPLRQIYAISGYTEGYAKYVEALAAGYLELDSELVELYCLNAMASGYITILADVGVHGEGWTRQQARDFLMKSGIPEGSFDAIYEQIVANPGIFLPYYGGQMEFSQLRKQAEETLGSDFDEVAFHEEILRYGPVSFDFLKLKLDAYLATQKLPQAA